MENYWSITLYLRLLPPSVQVVQSTAAALAGSSSSESGSGTLESVSMMNPDDTMSYHVLPN